MRAGESQDVYHGKSIAYGRRHDFVVFIAAPGKVPDDEEWVGYVGRLKAWSDQHETLRLLVISHDSAPTAAQRSLFNREVASYKMRIAAMLGSKKLLPIAKVFAWFVRSIEVFGPGDFDKALQYLDNPPITDVKWLFAELGIEASTVRQKGG